MCIGYVFCECICLFKEVSVYRLHGVKIYCLQFLIYKIFKHKYSIISSIFYTIRN